MRDQTKPVVIQNKQRKKEREQENGFFFYFVFFTKSVFQQKMELSLFFRNDWGDRTQKFLQILLLWNFVTSERQAL